MEFDGITIEPTRKKRVNPPTPMMLDTLIELIKQGYSVIFNVKIDSKKGKIYVTEKCAIINNIIDVEDMW